MEVVMNDGSRDLQQLQQQRTALAQRLRLPWWYLAATALLMAGVLALPFLQPRHISESVGQSSLLVLILVQIGLGRLLVRTTGVKYRGRDTIYPSARPVMWVTCAVAAVVGILLWQNAAIHHGIRQGRAVSR
jgi:uncharacterized membrane-anchored protein